MNIFHRSKNGVAPTATEFARDLFIDPVYVHLRTRGFSHFESFAASYADSYTGRPSDIEECCVALEETDRYKEEFREVLKCYVHEELVAHWDAQMSLSKVKPSISAANIREFIAAQDAKYIKTLETLELGKRKGKDLTLTEQYQLLTDSELQFVGNGAKSLV